jgi:two-component system cell cycle response regulator
MGTTSGELMDGGSVANDGTSFSLSRGVCYLVKEKKPDLAYQIFRQLLGEGMPGIVITRQYPDRVRGDRGLAPEVKILWLSHTPGEDNHNPTAIGTLAKTISRFIEDAKGEAVVLLDGLEFLIVNNGFLQTLMFVEHVNEFVMQRKAVVVIPASPEALEEKERALLERNVEVLEPPVVKMDLEMRQVSKLLDTY